MDYNTRYPKPWQIGKVDLDPTSDIHFEPRLSTIELVDANEKVICTIRIHVQYVARDIIDTINECDKINKTKKVQHCADCFYYAKDILTDEVKCKFPKECVNKKLFERKSNTYD